MTKLTKPDYTEIWATAAGGGSVAPDTLKIQTGWIVERPDFEYMNWIQNRQDTGIAYAFQLGVPEWDSTVEYQFSSNNWASYTQYKGKVYKSIQTGTNKNPETQTAYWALAFADYGAASETFAGVAELATQAETNTGSDDARIVTPAKLNAYITQRQATETLVGAAEVATNAEAAAGSDDLRIITALKLKYVLDNRASTETVQGTAEIATQAETNAGSDDARIVSPLKLDAYITQRQATETLKGVAEVATNAETNALSDDARIVTPLKLGNGFAISVGANGYIKLPSWLSGFTIQWGYATPSTATESISFPAVFANNAFAVACSANQTTGANVEYVGVSALSTSAFTAVGSAIDTSGSGIVSQALPFWWIAIGN